jgi:uncharacterized protein (TIGR01319 family)
MITDKNLLNTVLVTDCGSTTTKALLFQKTADGWRHTGRGEAPTTVEEPVADVTVGARNAFAEVQETTGRTVLASTPTNHPFNVEPTHGIDLYLSTSSAGGGLQMMVAGIVGQMSTESATRAALGAGAIVMDAISADDGREDHERIEKIRHVRPDIVLLTGGVDGGSKSHVLELAEILLAASPRPRFGDTLKLPIVYAGNCDAASEVVKLLEQAATVTVVDNVRPTLEREHLAPAREAIHELFLSHVMSHSPGYGTLLSWTPLPIVPTPAAVGDIVQTFAEQRQAQVLCADIGGATTDVFSVFRDRSAVPVFNRTVSANYGMSYSIANVLIEAGVEAIARWLPFPLHPAEVRDRLRNKMIRPTTIPQNVEDLYVEHAVCREALRLSLEHHRSLAVGLSGGQQQRSIGDIFTQSSNRYQLIDMMQLDVVIGSGGVLSHAPHRLQAALMMLEGFGLSGITEITVDSIFMMPHLGVFAKVHPEAAREIFEQDCLVSIAHSVVPVWPEGSRDGKKLCTVLVNGETIATLSGGELIHIPYAPRQTVSLEVVPLQRDISLGGKRGERVVRQIVTGLHGFILDGRNRPIILPHDLAAAHLEQRRVYEALGLPLPGGIHG